MDLFAYTQIEGLSKVAEKNGIYVPRLRGYRLMKDERPVSDEEIVRMIDRQALYVVDELCSSCPPWDPNSNTTTWNRMADKRTTYFLLYSHDEDGRKTATGIRWDRIHGKKRRILKLEIKKAAKRIRDQYALWNKYAGRDGVLYIHSRIGGNNWDFFDGKNLVESKPWFLGRADDYFDGTYCDIYAKIEGETHETLD